MHGILYTVLATHPPVHITNNSPTQPTLHPKSTVLQKSVDNMVRQQSSLPTVLCPVDMAFMLLRHTPRQRISS